MGQATYRAVQEEEGRTQVFHACAVREPAGDNFCIVYQFMNEMRPRVRSQLAIWVATPLKPSPLICILTGGGPDGPNEFKGHF